MSIATQLYPRITKTVQLFCFFSSIYMRQFALLAYNPLHPLLPVFFFFLSVVEWFFTSGFWSYEALPFATVGWICVFFFFTHPFIWSLFTALHVLIGVNSISGKYIKMPSYLYPNDKYLCEMNYILRSYVRNEQFFLTLLFPSGKLVSSTCQKSCTK